MRIREAPIAEALGLRPFSSVGLEPGGGRCGGMKVISRILMVVAAPVIALELAGYAARPFCLSR